MVPTWFADLPMLSPIDLSRQKQWDAGSSKATDRAPPWETGFLNLRSHGSAGYTKRRRSACSAVSF